MRVFREKFTTAQFPLLSLRPSPSPPFLPSSSLRLPLSPSLPSPFSGGTEVSPPEKFLELEILVGEF